ncbi:MAG: glycosyl transferase [Micavibrio sp.]|nr:MAG: glycosyl transferase [Micavibrio sp.]
MSAFNEIIVVDSNSIDATQKISAECGARVENFSWDGRYPKKRQWCLDHLSLKNNWVFFVDADEVVTQELTDEIASLFEGEPPCAGYFVQGRYHWQNKMLRYGLRNNKLCLLDRRKVCFPVIDDLDMPGMGEIEGHYQPVLRDVCKGEPIGQLKSALLHYAYEDKESWLRRHERYADWEVAMNKKRAWPGEVSTTRSLIKGLFRAIPFRPTIAFLHSYLFKGGIFDGRAGFDFALSRLIYYRMISSRS